VLTQRKLRAFRNCWLLKRCDSRCPGGWPIPSSVRYHALALSLRVGGGTILPTRRRRGRGTPAPAALDRLITDDATWRRRPTQYATWRRRPTQYAMIMAAKPNEETPTQCVHGGVRAAAAAVTKTWHRLAGNQMTRVETCIQRMAETVERSEGLSKCLCLSVMGCSAPC
jgi:hypothetical protein